jgi:hypothetical protein
MRPDSGSHVNGLVGAYICIKIIQVTLGNTWSLQYFNDKNSLSATDIFIAILYFYYLVFIFTIYYYLCKFYLLLEYYNYIKMAIGGFKLRAQAITHLYLLC